MITRILVPTDFSPAADIALQYAIDMAQRLGAQTHLLHVVDDLSFAGSVAERVVRTAPCAVLTVCDSSRTADVIAAERVASHASA